MPCERIRCKSPTHIQPKRNTTAGLFSNARNTRNKTRQPLKMLVPRKDGKTRKSQTYFILTRCARFSILCERKTSATWHQPTTNVHTHDRNDFSIFIFLRRFVMILCTKRISVLTKLQKFLLLQAAQWKIFFNFDSSVNFSVRDIINYIFVSRNNELTFFYNTTSV